MKNPRVKKFLMPYLSASFPVKNSRRMSGIATMKSVVPMTLLLMPSSVRNKGKKV